MIIFSIQIGDDSTLLNASFIVYASDSLFQSALINANLHGNGTPLAVASAVVSMSIGDADLQNLTDPVLIELSVRK